MNTMINYSTQVQGRVRIASVAAGMIVWLPSTVKMVRRFPLSFRNIGTEKITGGHGPFDREFYIKPEE